MKLELLHIYTTSDFYRISDSMHINGFNIIISRGQFNTAALNYILKARSANEIIFLKKL